MNDLKAVVAEMQEKAKAWEYDWPYGSAVDDWADRIEAVLQARAAQAVACSQREQILEVLRPFLDTGDSRTAADFAVAVALILSEAPTTSGLTDAQERIAAEQEYTVSAFDYVDAPVGSRDWTLFWKGWQARSLLAPRTIAQCREINAISKDSP